MILILNWGYEIGTDELLDVLKKHPKVDNVGYIADLVSISKSTLNRRLKKLKDDGLLVVYRYSNNNFVWMIGLDAESKYNGYEAMQIAKYRRYISFGADQEEFDKYSEIEKENILHDVAVFPEQSEEMFGKIERYSNRTKRENDIYRKISAIFRAKDYPVTKDLEEYVDKLWSRA